MSREEWWRELFACLDTKQTRRFLEYLTPDALFRYGSSPPAVGHAEIRGVLDLFLGSIGSSSHLIGRTWAAPSAVICQGEVKYVLLDGAEVQLPFCKVLSMAGDKISRYEVYIDPTPLLPA